MTRKAPFVFDKTQKTSAFLVSIFVLSLCGVFTPSPIAAEDSFFSPYTKVTLPNGLVIIVKEDHSVPIAAVDIRVAVGAIDESPEVAGISHFIEHMLFKGTERAGAGSANREIQALGGIRNAMTSQDTTNYHVTLPSEHIDAALAIQADAILHSAFDPKEVDRERDVLLEELRMRQDQPIDVVEIGTVFKTLFAGTPYANDVIGNQETLHAIRRENLLAYYRRYYVGGNTAIAVVGDVNTARIIDRLTELFGSMEPGKREATPKIEVTKLETIRRVEVEKEVSQSYLLFSFPVPPLKSEDGAALGILGVLLGGGKNARLNDLYGEGLVKNIQVNCESFRDAGMFMIYAETQDPSTVERRIVSVLKRIMDTGVTDEEVSRAKKILYGNFAADMERALSRAFRLSNLEICSSVEDGDAYLRRLQAVTGEDIRRAVCTYVHPERYLLLSIGPKEALR